MGIDLPAFDSRAPGAGAGDCRSRNSFPAPGTGRVRWRSRLDQLVFERAPQPFDENVVERAPAAVHADRDATAFERSQKIGRGELRTLIGVPDFGLPETKRGVQRRQAETGFHRVGEFPTEHETAE